MTLTAAEKAHEKRVRRMAERQLCELSRSRIRDPMAWGYGTYSLKYWGRLLVSDVSLDEAERFLSTGRTRERIREIRAERKKSVAVAAGVAGGPGQTRPNGPGSDPRSDPRRDPTAPE